MRLIDADAVIAEQYDILQKLYGGMKQALKDHLDIDDDLSVPIHAMEMYSRAKQFYYGVKGIMENAPTVDAVPVVRCKDCEYSNKALYGWLWCTAGPCEGKVVLEDFYCKCGERRVENGKAVDEG